MIELRCAPAGVAATQVRIGALDPTTLSPSFVLADERVLRAHPPLAALAPRMKLPGGESCKTFATLERVLRHMSRLGLDRGARLTALGGGSIGDLGGLCAALYLRGIALTQVPTTLLAMLDSSVGGKTAIDLPEGKNLVGHLWPADDVRIDPRLLSSLPDREMASGLGEAIKVALGLEGELFGLLEAERAAVLARSPEALERVIARAVAAKIRIVESDPNERGPRRLLNLGHTLGHALEAHAAGRLPHGVAVARGLHFALDVGRRLGTIGAGDEGRARSLLRAYGFEPWPLPPAGELLPFVRRDKKVEGRHLHFVLPTGVGQSRTEALAIDDLAAALHGTES